MARSRSRKSPARARPRRLFVERLEQRRVLATFVVDTPLDVVDLEDGVTSLREALDAANLSGGVDRIEFEPLVFSSSTTISLDLGKLVILDSVAIVGPESNLTLDAGQNSRVVDVSSLASQVALENLILTGGVTTLDSESGAGIRFLSAGTLLLTNVDVVGNRTSGQDSTGGGVFSIGSLHLRDTLVSGNQTLGVDAHGGGISVVNGSIVISDSEIAGNRTAGDGARGGGIYAQVGSVTLNESQLNHNATTGDESEGGGIFAGGELTIVKSTVTGNETEGEDSDGGGISAHGDVHVTDSSISDNRAFGRFAGGGAIATRDAAITLTASSVTGNSTAGEQGFGGGILAVRGDVNLTNSTLSGNQAQNASADGGALASFFGNVQVDSSTITQNFGARGGGLSFSDDQDKTLTIQNSIIAENSDTGVAPDFLPPQDFFALAVNSSLVGNNLGTGLNESQTANENGNLIGAPDRELNPLLAPLRFNGRTFIHPLSTSSPAIDSGDNGLVNSAFDGRGAPFVRIDGGQTDMGAFERQTIDASLLRVTTDLDEFDFGNAEVSLREALHVANANLGADTISFDDVALPGPFSINLTAGQLQISDTTTVEGPGADRLTIDAGGSSRVLNVLEGAGDVTLSGMTITGGRTRRDDSELPDALNAGASAVDGGGIRFVSPGTLSLLNIQVVDNHTLGRGASGGGIFNDSGTLNVSGGLIADNTTSGDSATGGGISSQSGSLTLADSNVANNQAAGQGGGIHAGDAGLTVSHSAISGNRTTGASAPGGGIASRGSLLRVTDTVITNNRTDGNQSGGGGIYSASGFFTLDRSEVRDNRTLGSDSSGGGIVSLGTLTITQSELADNRTAGNGSAGGGLFADTVTVIDSTIATNETSGANADGGGIRADSATLTNSTVSGNLTLDSSSVGGAIRLSNGQVRSSVITLNASAGRSGGIELDDSATSQLDVENSIVAGNVAATTANDLFIPEARNGAADITFTLIGDNTGNGLAEAQTPDASSNLVGSPAPGQGIIDPLLAPLANNGGPTKTHALMPGSPAINRGSAALAGSLVNDQRGLMFRRVADGQLDMGAYERQSLPIDLFVVTTAVDQRDHSDDSVSLREAIEAANGSAGVDTITFDAATFSTPQIIALSFGELEITDGVNIVGPGREALSIDAQSLSRVMNFSAHGGDLALSGLTLTNGSAPQGGRGGGIQFAPATGTLTLLDVDVVGNRAESDGGGVFSAGSTNITSSLIANNRTTAGGDGGGIASHSLTISGSVVSGNVTEQNDSPGGGIWSETAVISQTTIETNQTLGQNSRGGGVAASHTELLDSIVRNNDAVNSVGGGISTTEFLRLTASTVSSNTAGGSGGGIHALVGTSSDVPVLEIFNSGISLNETTGASSHGGGVFVLGHSEVADSTISSNVATGLDSDGGGIYVDGGQLDIARSTIAMNVASGVGGGVLVPLTTIFPLSIQNSILAANQDSGAAPNFRGVMFPANLVVESTLIDDNTGTSLSEAQTPDASGNLIGRPVPDGAGVIDAGLAPLATIAGAQVHPLMPTSPAIDSGISNPDLPANDQRGVPFARVFGGMIDRGAFESQSPVVPVITWNDPAAILVGTPLSETQLNATTNTPGTFDYSPALDTILGEGTGQTLSVSFTPDDTTHFQSASASVTIDVLPALDLGDAPESFATTLASDGPRHLVTDLRLGDSIDSEVDGSPSQRADGDGLDEDGVTAISSLVTDVENATIASFLVNVSDDAKLDAWFDFNGNGVFDHPVEHIRGGTSVDLRRGDNVVAVTVPAGSQTGETFARFRVSTQGALLPTGLASDGEVEDYQFTILDGSLAPVVDIALPRATTTLARAQDDLFVLQRGEILFGVPDRAISRYQIVATEFSDVLEIDNSNGNPLPSQGMNFDGGDRVNTIRLVGVDMTLDTASSSNLLLRNIDVFDLSDPSAQTIIIDTASARRMDPTRGGIIMTGSEGDRIVIDDATAWRMNEPTDVGGFSFSNVVTFGTFVQVDFASPWQNLAQLSDVNNDGMVTANDALIVINELSRRAFSDPATSELKNPSDVPLWPDTYYDQNGDGKATALDALRVINQLARIDRAGEAEFLPLAVQSPPLVGDASEQRSEVIDALLREEEFLPNLY